MTVRVTSTNDIRDAHHDIDGRTVEAIRTVLTERPDATVLWVAGWLTDEKRFDAVEANPQVAVGTIEKESDKAWLLTQPGSGFEPEWFPKSQARVFIRDPTVDEIDADQKTLGDL